MRIALIGFGRMGRAVAEVARARGHEVALRLQSSDNVRGKGITAAGFRNVDVAVDFSVPSAVVANASRLAEIGVDAVVGTTGWYDHVVEVQEKVTQAGTGFIHGPNFSLGVQLLFRLARTAGRLIRQLEEYDPSVLEIHHRHKLDHPSGTALKLAGILLAEVPRKQRWEQAPGGSPPDPAILQVASLRAGENPGVHVVALEGPDDRLELRHESRGRGAYARGAVAAAEWIHGRKGFYTIDDMLSDTLGTEV
ncbi:MAG: 4-hydroxy-tetrahydrodipicolinate reductase [Gemmatimonadetes bacterium]|nr:4-hydroxy-tetrahydrodipicolinate reductase [Gemmatimonadota bacterium]